MNKSNTVLELRIELPFELSDPIDVEKEGSYALQAEEKELEEGPYEHNSNLHGAGWSHFGLAKFHLANPKVRRVFEEIGRKEGASLGVMEDSLNFYRVYGKNIRLSTLWAMLKETGIEIGKPKTFDKRILKEI